MDVIVCLVLKLSDLENGLLKYIVEIDRFEYNRELRKIFESNENVFLDFYVVFFWIKFIKLCKYVVYVFICWI